ncbi:MAG: ABC transporter ATP-binding protein [Firmicutes bacterium]|jgi:peptide/nickel transport system ATP-binding protein|nr:ABC transporter ATP-binding protein [Bacillota bacterium]MDH7496123.1 ABC transporter ATP-binding protein [Bacillota bacterium]
MDALLELDDFTMHYRTKAGWVKAVDGVTLSLARGQALGLVGESGCGKTSIAMSVMKLLPYNSKVVRGRVLFEGRDIYSMTDEEVRRMRWKGVAMIFQAAMNSLNPVYRVGNQIVEAIVTHEPDTTEEEAWERVGSLFELVGIPKERMHNYPHEYSGGMKQRAVIAMALACNPRLIIADEPTTALDVIVQDKILREMDQIRRRINMSMIYISHDVSVIAEVSDVVAVMYAGKLVELGEADDVFKRPRHPYTYALMQAYPSILGEKHELATIPGEPPNLLDPPSGCRFHPRCDRASKECAAADPPWREIYPGHHCACHNPVGTRDARSELVRPAVGAHGGDGLGSSSNG